MRNFFQSHIRSDHAGSHNSLNIGQLHLACCQNVPDARFERLLQYFRTAGSCYVTRADLLPNGSLLFCGSSMPVRDLDQVMRPRRGIRVLANRGASGIDGLVSTAIGATIAHNGPGYALLGDLSLLHDQNGLILGPREPRPDLCLVVVNNDGGGIFSLLPQSALTDCFERVFGTPHGVDIGYLAAATGTPYTSVTDIADLPKAIRGEGLRIVEARTDREENAAVHAALRDAAQAAVRAVL